MENKTKKIVNKTGICIDNNNIDILYKYEYEGIYYENCLNGNLINNSTIKNCSCNEEECLSCPNIPLKEYLCTECNNDYYEIENDNNYNNYKKYYKDPLGYYLDGNIFKKCFYTCKECKINGNNITHNCIKCNDNYSYEIKMNNYSNCYINCSYYHYFDNNHSYCTLNSSCPEKYPKLIDGECVKNTEIKNNTTEEVTEYYDTIITNENYDTSKLDSDKDEIQEIERVTVTFIPIENQNKETKMKTKEEEIEYYNTILVYVENLFTNGSFNTSNLDNGKDEIIETEKLKVTFTTTQNQKNNINGNITSIDLGECEILQIQLKSNHYL